MYNELKTHQSFCHCDAVVRCCDFTDLHYIYLICILYIGFVFVFARKRCITFVFVSVSFRK